MEKQTVVELITEEKKQTPKCSCGKEMTFDMIKGKFFCLDCECHTDFNTDRRLVRNDVYKLKSLPTKSLVNIIQLRECRYNYLYNTWSQAAKGDRKTEFFFDRMKEKEEELNKIKEKGLNKVVKEERKAFIKKIKKLESKIEDIKRSKMVRNEKYRFIKKIKKLESKIEKMKTEINELESFKLMQRLEKKAVA